MFCVLRKNQSVLNGDKDSVKLMKSLAINLGEALSSTENILAPEMTVLSVSTPDYF